MASTEAPIRAALAHAAIRRVTFGFLALTLGEWVLGTAVAVGLFAEHGALVVALVGARFLPAAIASMAAGASAERRPARAVHTTAALARCAAAAGVVVALGTGAGVVVVALLVWLDAAAGSSYRPAQARLLPAVVTSPAELAAAATLLSTAKSAGQILGALTGSLLAAVGGATLGAVVAAVLFAAAAAAAWSGASVTTTVATDASAGTGWRSLLALRRGSGAVRVAAWSCARSLTRGAWTSLGVLVAISLLGLAEAGYGALMAAAGVGTIVGIALSARLVGRRHLAAPFVAALAAPALVFVLIGVVAAPAVALAGMVAWGAGMAVSDVAAQSLLTRVVPPSETARVVGAIEAAKLLAEGIGGLAAPAAASVFGLRAALIGAGVLLLGVLASDVAGFRRLDRLAVGRVELLDLARGVPLFRSLRVDGLEAVVAPLQTLDVDAGAQLITQDAVESQWFLVQSGSVEVLVDGFRVGTIGPGGSFGERGLMLNEVRSATARTLEPSRLLVLERDDFLRALTGTITVAGAQRVAGRDPQQLLSRQPLLHSAGSAVISQLVAAARTDRAPAGTWLCQQGEPSSAWLVISSGEVEILVDGEPRRTLGAGDGFGEIGVLHDVPRTASARAITDVELLSIDAVTLRDAIEIAPAVAGSQT